MNRSKQRVSRGVFAGAILIGAWLVAPAAFFTGRPVESAALTILDAPLFDRDTLVEHARTLSAYPYVPPPQLADPALRIDYDQYRSIAYDRDQAVWKDESLPFQLEMFHPGFLYNEKVDIALVDSEGVVEPMVFSAEQFTYGGTAVAPEAEDLGYSGFRAHAEINEPGRFDEFAVFQGATYFRGVGKDQAYGLSARGLAIATADPRGEEFPVFRKFWVEKPEPDAISLIVHGLMDSPSVVGAYRFTITPGETTLIDVEATLFPRVPLDLLGIAPLTSMFLFDQTNRWGFDDYRNAVHDSDGLQIVNGAGEHLWRPLANPRRLQTSAFVDNSPRGFGLMQRKRQHHDFNDFYARYQDRPSLWVEPSGEWGPGSVVLVEIPTEWETNDNIAAFWRPRHAAMPGQPYQFAYRLHWGADAPFVSPLMRVERTRTGASMAGKRFFVIDFDPETNQVPADYLEVEAHASSGTISTPHLETDPQTGTLRATFELDPQGRELVELRLRLTAAGAPASETWLYRWTPS